LTVLEGKAMPDESAHVYVCPGCGEVVARDEDYVVAKEYRLEPGFQLHLKGKGRAEGVERRFHVGHFRGRLGDCYYELVADSGEDRLRQ
jgi:hypothetical protein